MGNILTKLQQFKSTGKKMLALLLDPDRCVFEDLPQQHLDNVDLILVGSSVLTEQTTDKLCQQLKEISSTPLVLFPGNSNQVCESADGILFTSLISGRNPEFLIGQQIIGAPLVKKAGLEPIGTGYMIIESGNLTSATYITQTLPIPMDKPDIAVSTALAGEMLGFSAIYLEAGSGAKYPVPSEIISAVRHSVECLLFVGGGIKTTNQAEAAWVAGADIVVVGSVIERSPSLLEDFLISKASFTKSKLSS